MNTLKKDMMLTNFIKIMSPIPNSQPRRNFIFDLLIIMTQWITFSKISLLYIIKKNIRSFLKIVIYTLYHKKDGERQVLLHEVPNKYFALK